MGRYLLSPWYALRRAGVRLHAVDVPPKLSANLEERGRCSGRRRVDGARHHGPRRAWGSRDTWVGNRVDSVSSNLTGRPVFFWRTLALSAAYPLDATSSTFRPTTSQPRSLLSIAMLNNARSRVRPSTWSFVRIDQTCFGRSGGKAPTILPLSTGLAFGRSLRHLRHRS
jgi:hypothetical protein